MNGILIQIKEAMLGTQELDSKEKTLLLRNRREISPPRVFPFTIKLLLYSKMITMINSNIVFSYLYK